MADLKDRSGCEKTVVEDPETGREIWRMTNFHSHDLHTYYDACSWNPDGTKIAFTSIRPEDVVPDKLATIPKGALFVMDADGSNIHCLAETVDFKLHTGCFPIWKDNETIIYHGHGHTCMIDIHGGEIQEIKGLFSRFLSPDGSRLVCQWSDPGESRERAAFIVDLDSFSREKIVSSDDLTEVLLDTFNRASRMPDIDEQKMGTPQLANIKWSPDGSRLMLRFNYAPDEYLKSLFVLNPDGTGLKRLNMVTPRFGHHSWHPDGERILYCDRNETGPGHLYYLIDRDGFNRRVLHNEQLGSHPIFNPAGTEIVDFGKGFIWHLEVETGKVQKLASYTNDLHGGLHAHPSWSPDGSQIIYHSDHTGTSQIYVIPLK
ncbi:MAG: PD40 domain-containing protein [Planctomycetes bacterium]|nr:PD40 domain-containing protein [Planctomycetota bacterium]